MIPNDDVNYRLAECCMNCIYSKQDTELEEQSVCILFSEDRCHHNFVCDKFIKEPY